MNRSIIFAGLLLGSIWPLLSQQVIYEGGVNVVTVAGKSGVPGDRDGVGVEALFGDLGGVATIGEIGFVASTLGSRTSIRRINAGTTTTIASPPQNYRVVSDPKRFSILFGYDSEEHLRFDQNGNLIGRLSFFNRASIRGDFAIVPSFEGATSLRMLNLSTGNSVYIAGGNIRGAVDGVREEAGIVGVAYTCMGDGIGYLYDSGGFRTVSIEGAVQLLVAGGYEDGAIATAKAVPNQGMITDRDGNLIFAQQGAIRRLSKNRILTLAGSPNGSGNFDGDGFNARFSDIRGIAIDSANRLWVADQNCVRLVTFKESRKDAQPEAGIRLVPGITVSGEIGAVYRIEFQDSVGGVWQLLRLVALSKPTEEFFDYSTAGRARFYRAIAPE